MDIHCEGGLWKMFSDKVSVNARTWREVAPVDGGDKCRFDEAEGCCMD